MADQDSTPGWSSSQCYVGNRLPNGKWPALRVTTEKLSEHDTVSEAAAACMEATR